jgi:leucyl-tRNA synthetase
MKPQMCNISSSLAKFYRMRGFDVIHPIGWDSFGLPAENAAVERSIAADDWTRSNIEHMKGQMVRLGFDFDWSREISTCEPSYYRWTQEIFLLLHKQGLVAQVCSVLVCFIHAVTESQGSWLG